MWAVASNDAPIFNSQMHYFRTCVIILTIIDVAESLILNYCFLKCDINVFKIKVLRVFRLYNTCIYLYLLVYSYIYLCPDFEGLFTLFTTYAKKILWKMFRWKYSCISKKIHTSLATWASARVMCWNKRCVTQIFFYLEVHKKLPMPNARLSIFACAFWSALVARHSLVMLRASIF